MLVKTTRLATLCGFLSMSAVFMHSTLHAQALSLDFLRGVITAPAQTGALVPCSRYVARETTRHLKRMVMSDQRHIRVLEVGGGSGALSQEIVQVLNDFSGTYHVDILEIEDHYADILRTMFADNDNVTIHCVDATQWSCDEKYDCIIGSVPFNSVPIAVVEGVLKLYTDALAPHGVVSYVEYMGFAELRKNFEPGQSGRNFCERYALLEKFREDYCFESVKVWLNVPPIYVYHLNLDKKEQE